MLALCQNFGMAKPLPSAHAVTALILQEQDDAGRNVDKMQLQKLLYLVLGAHYALWGTKAFKESPVAYRNGPVFPNVEASYRDASTEMVITSSLGGDPDAVPDEVAGTVRLVLEYFGQWDARGVENFTKQPGTPWRTVRRGLPANAVSDIPIDESLVVSWFRQHGVNPRPPRYIKRDMDALEQWADGNEEALADLLQ